MAFQSISAKFSTLENIPTVTNHRHNSSLEANLLRSLGTPINCCLKRAARNKNCFVNVLQINASSAFKWEKNYYDLLHIFKKMHLHRLTLQSFELKCNFAHFHTFQYFFFYWGRHESHYNGNDYLPAVNQNWNIVAILSDIWCWLLLKKYIWSSSRETI